MYVRISSLLAARTNRTAYESLKVLRTSLIIKCYVSFARPHFLHHYIQFINFESLARKLLIRPSQSTFSFTLYVMCFYNIEWEYLSRQLKTFHSSVCLLESSHPQSILFAQRENINIILSGFPIVRRFLTFFYVFRSPPLTSRFLRYAAIRFLLSFLLENNSSWKISNSFLRPACFQLIYCFPYFFWLRLDCFLFTLRWDVFSFTFQKAECILRMNLNLMYILRSSKQWIKIPVTFCLDGIRDEILGYFKKQRWTLLTD